MSQPLIVHAGLDESGSLSAATSLFTMAIVVARHPETLRHVIRRIAFRSGKRLGRPRTATSELKWRNASQRLRHDILARMAEMDIDLFALTMHKQGRRIGDSPENYAILACELLRSCWSVYPNMALSLDRHFSSPAQVAVVNTFIHRQWPGCGVLSITHVDSQRNPLVQLADFAAGCVYDWNKRQDETYRLIDSKISAALVEDWQQIKERWLFQAK